MAALGISSDVARYATVDLLKAVDHYECFVLHRVPWSDRVESFVTAVRSRGKLVLSDFDDLIFKPELSGHIEAIAGMSTGDRASWTGRLRRTIMASNGAIVSTEHLATFARGLTDDCEVVFNSVSEEMIGRAEHVRRSRPLSRSDAPSGTTVIAYFSGTRTHQADFAELAESIRWALETYPSARFLSAGQLDLDQSFDRFSARVERVPVQPWHRLPDLVSQIDINLAPLAKGSPFNECKSCVKYLEAALLGVPTVASPRSDFARVIEHGRNGLLADSPDEWREALRLLIENPERRREMGRWAYEDVHRHHTTRARAESIERSFRSLARSHRSAGDRLEVNWLLGARCLRSPARLRGVVELAGFLGRSGHRVRLYVAPIGDLARLAEAEVAASLEESPGMVKAVVETGLDDMDPADAGIATDTSTAYILDRHGASLFKFRYVVELDERGYELPLRHICRDEELADRFAAISGRAAEFLAPSSSVPQSVATLDSQREPGRQLEQILLRTCFLRMSYSTPSRCCYVPASQDARTSKTSR